MQRQLLSLLIGAAMTLSASATGKPGVTIYATGGTIAGSSKSNTDTTGYQPGALGVEVLINAVPEMKEVATVTGEQIANVGSFDMNTEVLLKLARSINRKLAEPGTAGVVITHGTDTTEETAFFLDLTVSSPKPVVVVGAMRPATAISADGPMNLLEAVTLAAAPQAQNRGTMVVLNDRIASGFYITKTNSLMIDTFKAAEQGYLGAFVGGAPKFYFEPARPVGKPSFNVDRLDKLPKVAVLYTHQESDSDLLDAAVKGGAKGLVIAGVGNGNVPTAVKAKIKELAAAGIPVVISTRTGSGYVTAKAEGIGAGVYNPQKARILLQLALAQGADQARIRGYFGS
jgi:L-asparaginase